VNPITTAVQKATVELCTVYVKLYNLCMRNVGRNELTAPALKQLEKTPPDLTSLQSTKSEPEVLPLEIPKIYQARL